MPNSILQNQRFWRPAAALLCLLAGQSVLAQVKLTPAQVVVSSGGSVSLEVQRTDGAAAAWTWHLEGAPGASIAPASLLDSGSWRFNAPMVSRFTHLQVRVSDGARPEDSATVSVLILPPISERGDRLVDSVISDHFKDDWPLAKATLFGQLAPVSAPPASDPQSAAAGAAAAAALPADPDQEPLMLPAPADGLLQSLAQPETVQVTCVQRLEGDPALPELDGKWMVGHARGLKVVNAQGQVEQELPLPPAAVGALAVRPTHSAPGNPLHVVFSLGQQGAGQGQAQPLQAQRLQGQDQLWRLGPDGIPKRFAGVALTDPRLSRYQDGPADQAKFGRIVGLAMDPAGTVLVADQGNGLIRRVAQDGHVSTLAGRPPGSSLLRRALFPEAADGVGQAARFTLLGGLTRDPSSGDLYVTDGHCIRKITPDGLVSTLLGVNGKAGFAPEDPEQPVPLGQACLNTPGALQFYRGKLFILDHGNRSLRVFHLGSRKLDTVLGYPSQRAFRLGPIRRFNPDLPLEACAALPDASALAITPGGTCLVGSGQNLVQLYLGTLVEHAKPLKVAPDGSSSSAAPRPASQLNP